jgi:hypothetical protein
MSPLVLVLPGDTPDVPQAQAENASSVPSDDPWSQKISIG